MAKFEKGDKVQCLYEGLISPVIGKMCLEIGDVILVHETFESKFQGTCLDGTGGPWHYPYSHFKLVPSEDNLKLQNSGKDVPMPNFELCPSPFRHVPKVLATVASVGAIGYIVSHAGAQQTMSCIEQFAQTKPGMAVAVAATALAVSWMGAGSLAAVKKSIMGTFDIFDRRRAVTRQKEEGKKNEMAEIVALVVAQMPQNQASPATLAWREGVAVKWVKDSTNGTPVNGRTARVGDMALVTSFNSTEFSYRDSKGGTGTGRISEVRLIG